MKHCPICGGPLAFLGALGTTNYYRCCDCGMDVSTAAALDENDWDDVDEEEDDA